jgi:hypothetical protein
MAPIPFPSRQTVISVCPGSYAALSKTPFSQLPMVGPPPQAHPPAVADAEAAPPWLTKLTNGLNSALATLNQALLTANRNYGNGAECSDAVANPEVAAKIKDSLDAIHKQLHGFFWPPVRPPFRGRQKDYVESDQFPLKENVLPKTHKGYVTFRCDSVEAPGTRELASWGFVTNFSVVFFETESGSSEDRCNGVREGRERWGDDCSSSSSSTAL